MNMGPTASRACARYIWHPADVHVSHPCRSPSTTRTDRFALRLPPPSLRPRSRGGSQRATGRRDARCRVWRCLLRVRRRALCVLSAKCALSLTPPPCSRLSVTSPRLSVSLPFRRASACAGAKVRALNPKPCVLCFGTAVCAPRVHAGRRPACRHFARPRPSYAMTCPCEQLTTRSTLCARLPSPIRLCGFSKCEDANISINPKSYIIL